MHLAPAPAAELSTCLQPNLPVRRAKHRPVLIFQGGGYDGCLWEWNVQPGSPYLPEGEQPAVSGTTGARVLQAAKEGGLQAAVAAASISAR